MNTELQATAIEPDPAAVFTIAHSLWEICEKRSHQNNFNISECYNGVDQFIREIMRIANLFENWACHHINFDEFDEVWAYYLGDNFGKSCLTVVPLNCLMDFGEADCLRVALHLRLPVVLDDKLPVPLDLTSPNPVAQAGFRDFRIQTVRNSIEDEYAVPFVADDEPFDEEFGKHYFSLYGVGEDRKLEHIPDRTTYAEVLSLAQKIAPGIAFPSKPTFSRNRSRRT
jgi:hypothetical protein